VFNAGAYQPDTWQGWRLLAHELAHVTQPRLTGAPPVSQPGDASEREAGAAADSSINTVIREVSVLGFGRFWELVKVEHPDVANDPAVLELNMTKEARERFAAGIGQFRARMLKAVEEQMKLRIKKPAAAPK